MLKHSLKTVGWLALSLTLIGGQVDPGAGNAAAQFRIVTYEQILGPPFGLVEGSPGLFYSMGGTPNPVAFSVSSQGVQTILATFSGENFITAPFVSANNGEFYSGLELDGGFSGGSVFSVTSAPGKTIYPPSKKSAGFTQNLPDGTLLGFAFTATNNLFLIKGTLQGALTQLYQFPAGETTPWTALYASDGNYYGVSFINNGAGYVYRVTPAGVRTNIYTFSTGSFGGGARYMPLVQASDGNLYGATNYGGANGTGTVYKLTLSGQYTLLYTFPTGSEYHPTAMIEGSDGNLYGASGLTGSVSLLFKVTKAGKYTLLYAMRDAARDGGCLCLLTLGSDGVIYGTALYGGVQGAGDIFALNAGLPKPRPRARQFTPQSGAVGTQVLIWGYNLLAASVSFNGVSATTVSNSGSNYVWATVPAGATTGPITVTTPGGTTTTHASFTVL